MRLSRALCLRRAAGRGGARGAVVPLTTRYSLFATRSFEPGTTNARNAGARPGAPAQGAAPGRGGVRRLHARALRHRRLALPDHADRRGGAALGERGRARARARARGGRQRAGARRRHLAGRPDRQRLAGDRLRALSRPPGRARRRRQALRGRARHRARRAQPPAQAARPLVPGRHLDRLARHHRRHGRQQFLRRALAALRQHPRERARRSTPSWPTARSSISVRPPATSPTCRPIRRSSRWRAA